MPSINGIDFNNINSINGVSWNSVTDISGVDISHGASCISLSFGYSDGTGIPPSNSCLVRPFFYDFDSTNNLLYVSGGCGVTFATAGYYSDGVTIYSWDGSSSWSVFDACGI